MTLKQRLKQMCLGEARAEMIIRKDDTEGSTIEFDEDCKSPFTDELLSILSKLDEGEPVIVYLESQRFAAVLTAKLNAAGYKAQEYSGKSKADLDKFGDEFQILVASIAALGTGTDNLQAKCQVEVWFEHHVSITKNQQAEARLDRMGGKQVQRFRILDSGGYAMGRLDDMLAKALSIRKSMRRI